MKTAEAILLPIVCLPARAHCPLAGRAQAGPLLGGSLQRVSSSGAAARAPGLTAVGCKNFPKTCRSCTACPRPRLLSLVRCPSKRALTPLWPLHTQLCSASPTSLPPPLLCLPRCSASSTSLPPHFCRGLLPPALAAGQLNPVWKWDPITILILHSAPVVTCLCTAARIRCAQAGPEASSHHWPAPREPLHAA